MKPAKLIVEISRAPAPASVAYWERRYEASRRAMPQAEREAVERALVDRRGYFKSPEYLVALARTL